MMTEARAVYKNRKSIVPAMAPDIGKLPPQAVDLEEAVLGALMVDAKALFLVTSVLSADAFYKDSHQMIYKAIVSLSQNREPVDILTVVQQCKKDGTLELVGGPFYISSLTSRISSAANVEYHARVVAQKFIGRELIRISSGIINDAFDDTVDVFGLVDRFQSEAFSLGTLFHGKKERTIASLLADVEHDLDKPISKDGVIGVRTGFKKLDELTLGLQPGRLYLEAARPGMGKTTFALQLARNVAVSGVPVAFFSLEMPARDLVVKLIAMETGIQHKKIQMRNLNGAELQRVSTAVSELRNSKLYIDDSSGLTPFELMSKCRDLKQKYGIGLVVVDYLQLVVPAQTGRNFQNRNDEVSFVSASLKNISKDLEVPLFALSQLSRDLEKRTNKEPMLSDLRDSGSLEQDADLVMFLYRPGYYGINTNSSGDDISDLCKVIIAKNRHGGLDNIMQRFDGGLSKFNEYVKN